MAFRFGFFEPAEQQQQQPQQDEAAVASQSTTAAAAATERQPTQVEFLNIPAFCSKHGCDIVMNTLPLDSDRDTILIDLASNQNLEAGTWSATGKPIYTLGLHLDERNFPPLRHFTSAFLQRAILSLAQMKSGKKQQEDTDDAWYKHASEADIIPGKYLGGLKIWSCTLDVVRAVSQLGHYLLRPDFAETQDTGEIPMWIKLVAGRLRETNRQHQPQEQEQQQRRFTVADIGCGHGVCGAAAIRFGVASRVLFHDFNAEIATTCVAGTLQLNGLAQEQSAKEVTVAAASGDWGSFSRPVTTTNNTQQTPLLFDLIVAADVTYDEEASRKFLQLAGQILRRGGIALIGTKEFYFGTNGGSHMLNRCPELKPLYPPKDASNNDSNRLFRFTSSGTFGGERDMLRRIYCLTTKVDGE